MNAVCLCQTFLCLLGLVRSHRRGNRNFNDNFGGPNRSSRNRKILWAGAVSRDPAVVSAALKTFDTIKKRLKKKKPKRTTTAKTKPPTLPPRAVDEWGGKLLLQKYLTRPSLRRKVSFRETFVRKSSPQPQYFHAIRFSGTIFQDIPRRTKKNGKNARAGKKKIRKTRALSL